MSQLNYLDSTDSILFGVMSSRDWQKSWKHLEKETLRGFKVVEFGSNRKDKCNFLFVVNNIIVTLAISHRVTELGRLLVKMLPLGHTPASCNAFAWGDPLRIWTLYCQYYNQWATHQWRRYRPVFIRFDTILACDERTDRQTVRWTGRNAIANTARSITVRCNKKLSDRRDSARCKWCLFYWWTVKRPFKVTQVIPCCANRRDIYDFLLALNSNSTSSFNRS